MSGDRPVKLDRLFSVLDRHGASAIVLTTPESLTWFFDGARVSVTYGGQPVLTALVERSGDVTVSVWANELDRVRDEELGDRVELRAVPWHAALPARTAGTVLDRDLADDLRAIRAPLLPEEMARYRTLGSEIATATTAVLRSARVAMTERELAAELAHAVVRLGAEPVVLLVAGEMRLSRQHPLPTTAPLGMRAMAVVGARRHGLNVSLTRWIRFAESLEDDRIDAALREVEGDLFVATRPGRELRDVVSDVANSYERHGFGSDAWLRHHQGGPTGYLGRDPKATLESHDLVVTGQAFAWNPSVDRAKLEDTIVVGDDGIEVLTRDDAWPTAVVRGVPRPLSLRLEEGNMR